MRATAIVFSITRKKIIKLNLCRYGGGKEIKMSVLTVTKNNFDEVLKSDKPVLLDFWASWCGPCRMMSPVVDEIAEENSGYLVGKVNVDEEGELAQQFGIMSIPTLVVIKNGEEKSRMVGVRKKAEVISEIEK